MTHHPNTPASRTEQAAPSVASGVESGARESQVITLCGSARFERLFKAWNEALTMAGHTVFSLTAYPSDKSDVKEWYTDEQKTALDAAHFRKIAASNAIFVLNLHAYIGESTLREIEHARLLGKTVYFLESWGKGLGVGGAHTDEAQRAAISDGLTLPTASPIDTTTRSGATDPWASRLLGPAGRLRSSIVELTRRAALAAPGAAIVAREQEATPIELRGVAETLENQDGCWRSCSGCHELNEGHDTGPYSAVLKCHLGGGCSECGGIGAIWDTTDYADIAALSGLEHVGKESE